jgi:hypothetical protein
MEKQLILSLRNQLAHSLIPPKAAYEPACPCPDRSRGDTSREAEWNGPGNPTRIHPLNMEFPRDKGFCLLRFEITADATGFAMWQPRSHNFNVFTQLERVENPSRSK